MVRAAILIAVNKTGGLPPLQSPSRDARRVEDWLKREGFETTVISDTGTVPGDAGPVDAATIKRLVKEFVDRGTIEQLLIYFSGHGYCNFGTEIWLLSGAPEDASEAINLFASSEAAKDCGIKNVVFISDACRSNPTDPAARRVEGQPIFPNVVRGLHRRGKVDRFLATIPNAAAFEINETIDDAVERMSIFTTEFLAAHAPPKPSDAEKKLVGEIEIEDGQKRRVVLSAKLAPYLEERVPIAIQEKTNKRQQPECDVTSGVESFIGAATFAFPPATTVETAEVRPTGAVAIDLGMPSLREIAMANIRAEPRGPTRAPTTLERRYEAARQAVADVDVPAHFETETGILVSGARVGSAIASRFVPDILPARGEPYDLVRLNPPANDARAAGSIILEFEGGGGAVLAGLRGYIAAVTVRDGRVSNISYAPSTNSFRWRNTQPGENEQLRRLRMDVATAAKFGVFKLSGDEAWKFADRIRSLKKVDPTLGLYAAYAYRDADKEDEIRSVREFMREDLGCDLFDIALLNDDLRSDYPKFPFCPMLMRGWSLLLVTDYDLPEVVKKASKHLIPSLWTTFAQEGLDMLKSALSRGELK